jgi:cell division protein FtsZ
MGAKWILLNITSAEGEFEHTIDEMDIIQAYVRQQAGEDCDVILGMGYDNTLSNKLGVTIIATGFEQKPIALQKKKPEAPKEEPKIVMELGKVDEEKKMYNQTAIEFVPEDEMAPRLTEPAQTESAHAEPQPAEPQPPQPEPQHQQPAQPPQPEPQHREPPRPTPSAVQLEIPPAAEEPPMRLTLKQEDVHGQEEEKKENTEPSQPSFAGGYLSRPTHIYAEPDTTGKAAPQTPPEKEQPDMKLVIKDEQAAGSQADTEGSLEETEEQKRKAAERIARLRDMSFNVKNLENPHELETIPAYIRRNISLPDNNSSAEDPSGYTVTQREDGRRAEISTINTFLEGKKPD